jgi:hypothetical protein
MSSSVQDLIKTTVDTVVADGVTALTGTDTAAGAHTLSPLTFTTGLATAPHVLPRPLFGLGTQLLVPPGTGAVVYLPDGEQRVYIPGNYRLWNVGVGTITVQWVDARCHQVPLGPIEGWSLDKWRVRVWLVVDVQVVDPARIAQHHAPLGTLVAAARTSVLHYMEQHTHAALTGSDEQGGIDAPATAITARLRGDPALVGLHVINVRVLERQGDERQIEAATAATVAAAHITEEMRVAAARHQAQLQALDSQHAVAEREHTLRMAETAATAREQLLTQQAEVQQATLAARLNIVLAQIESQTSEIARDEQVWQAEQARMHGEWERAQQQLSDAHRTDQQVRLLDAQHTMLRSDTDALLATQDRQQAHALALAEIQARIEEQRTAQAHAMTERRAQHEQTLLELHLRHEQLVSEQMGRLEQWRTEHMQVSVQTQRQHDRQLAVIAGTAQVAAAAANPAPIAATEQHIPNEVAETGLRTLQTLAE